MLVSAGDFSSPLSPEVVEQAKTWIDAMKENPRGPYAGISWYCNDGTTQLPKSYACVEHGGGKQYGVLTQEARKLGKYGVHVGTVLASLQSTDLLEDNLYRARALVVETYLERALGGWVLQSAKSYRGFRQIEDEQEAARALLIDLMKRHDVFAKERFLAIRLTRALPYGRSESLADEIRALAGQIGDADPRFANMRFKIHAMPEPQDIDGVEAYCQQATGDQLQQGKDLIDKMRAYYDPTTRVERLKEVRRWLRDDIIREKIDLFVACNPKDSRQIIEQGAALIETVAAQLKPGSSDRQGERNLLALHVMGMVEELWVGITAPLRQLPLTRHDMLHLTETLLRSTHHLGLLSQRELEQASTYINQARQGEARVYATAATSLGQVLDWIRVRLSRDLGEPLLRYQAVEPRARGVLDDIMRSGAVLPLATLLDRMGQDADRLRGGGHRLLGLDTSVKVDAQLKGENPGLVTAPLQILLPGADPQTLQRQNIALLQELPPELPPVAGILTVGSSGSLSHVALLARNLGIPHASISSELAKVLSTQKNQPWVLGVSQGRRVLLATLTSLSPDMRQSLENHSVTEHPSLQINAAALDLSTTSILPISSISSKDSGVRCGPKAAELGRLKAMFPNRVSDAAVIPFGAFKQHVDRPNATGPSPLRAMQDAYAKARLLPPEQGEAKLLEALAKFRQAITDTPFADGFEQEVKSALEHMGKLNSFGVFVRSDTNVEDLKEFTGAGLNKTIANRVGLKSVLAAIREVWASPYTERSFRWRQRLLKNPEHVYPSVILHRTVASEFSGVLVTTDLQGNTPNALTVSASEGVAAVVDGGSPETVVLQEDGTVRLLASSRTLSRKQIPPPPREGVIVTPSTGKDPLLGDAELREIRQLAREVLTKVPPQEGLPWDIEFGFLHGKAYLMQIRPLRTSQVNVRHPLLVRLDLEAQVPAIRLDMNLEVL
ncbi:MAG: PEP/pyruvate-binding domain-containing protein [Myxococcota bacterium]